MASTSYTKNLGLCAWESTDRPKRMDFVQDNNIIDTKLGEHIVDSGIHVTQDEKDAIASPYKVVTYVGDGAAQKTISLDKSYSYAIVFQKFYPPVEMDSNGNAVIRFAIVGRTFGSNADIMLKSNSIVVVQGASVTEGMKNNFNEDEGQYVIMLFR
ncbi:MAG: hypothetical protein E7513_05945 [Ruminococcaceae bacterium]|nr:hypothetical protein [Oscillospiraceae bacterium]